MRSVNGPPGTGKTTLLKDIFAQLVVQSRRMILRSFRVILSKEQRKRFILIMHQLGNSPKCITENNIVVASSNNGAVQNIVNELPLIKEIDNSLIEELKEADYFREISNAKISVEWIEDENGNKKSGTEKRICSGRRKSFGEYFHSRVEKRII